MKVHPSRGQKFLDALHNRAIARAEPWDGNAAPHQISQRMSPYRICPEFHQPEMGEKPRVQSVQAVPARAIRVRAQPPVFFL